MKRKRLRSGLLVAGLAALLGLGAGRADASLIVTTPSFSALAGSSGTFDVLLTNTGPSSVNIGGFSFGISSSNPGLTFPNATVNTVAAAYIFNGESLFGPDITISSGTSLVASDNPFLAASVAVGAGVTVGLGHVTYSVANGTAPGPVTLTLSPAATSLADATGGNIPINTLSSGTLTVGSAVPEPATFGLIGVAFVWALARRRE